MYDNKNIKLINLMINHPAFILACVYMDKYGIYNFYWELHSMQDFTDDIIWLGKIL